MTAHFSFDHQKKFRLLRVTCLLGLIIGTSSAFVGYTWLRDLGVFNIDESQLDIIMKWSPPDNSHVYDRHGTKIGEFYANYHIYTPFEKIPQFMVDAIVSIEDKNFWQHDGVDYQAIARAGLAFIKSGGQRNQGASTITQQVVRNFLLSKDKVFERKIREIFLARALEKNLSKEKIFEIYANAFFLGNRSYGLAAAAERYFNKKLHALDKHEITILAGLFQSPSRFDPTKNMPLAKKRQKQVLSAMINNHKLKRSDAAKIFKEEFVLSEVKQSSQNFAPYFVEYIREQSEKILNRNSIKGRGLRIYTSLDSQLQKFADESMKESESLLQKAAKYTKAIQDENGRWHDRRVESSLLVTSPKTGEILAMVGGRSFSDSQFNRSVTAMRSPGSSFKPIVYAYALTQGKKWSDLLYVAPVTVDGTYRPKNADQNYLTETTMLRALYKSMNGPTIELAKDLDINKVLKFAANMGIDTPIKEEFGSVLGSSETNLLSMAKMYSIFANGGNKIDLVAISKITDRDGKILYEAPSFEQRVTKVLEPQIAYLMTDGLKNVLRHGTASASYEMAKWAAGKTGTSNQSKDNWFCGYTSELTAVVWTGTDDYSPMNDLAQGASLALPIWTNFMKKAIRQKEPPPFHIPTDIVSLQIDPQYGTPNPMGINMWFTVNNQPTEEKSPLQALKIEGNYREVLNQ